MKKLGLIGGTSWVSTIDYYRGINKLVNETLGSYNSAPLFMYSLNMEEFYKIVVTEDWNRVGEFLADKAKKLEAAGSEAIIICANTPHIAAPYILERINIPMIHIVEETAKEIKRQGMSKVALQGTKVTMENGFYQDILRKYGIECIIPDEEDRDFIHKTIFHELGKEIFKPETKKRYQDIIEISKQQGAQGVILGCTEIPLLIQPEDSSIPTLDTTQIHVKAALEFILR